MVVSRSLYVGIFPTLTPAKEEEVTPWDTLCVDLIGPYKFKQANNQIHTRAP